MEYLLIMALSGSAMTLICLFLRCLSRNMVSARMYYLLAKAAVLYYLIPLPFLKRWYRGVVRAVLPEKEMEIARILLSKTNYAVHTDERIYVNAYAELQIAIVSVWLFVAVILMAGQLVKYLRTARWIARYTSTKMTERQKTYLAGIKGEYGIRRHVLLYQGMDGEPSMTFGVYRPVIICGREVGSREAELLIRHELVHIRRLDALWKMLMQLTVFIHWWNPVMWILYFMIDRFCELSCDETVMAGRSEEEIDEYLRLLIAEAQEESSSKKPSLRWEAGFGDNMREIRERVENLMSKKRWNKFAAGTLVATLIFANSMTVFAYKDTFHETIQENASQEEIESTLRVDETMFVPDGIDREVVQEVELVEETKILYDSQFTDEEGNIYPVPEITPQWGCDHTYVSGTLSDHTKNSDGSCVVTQYRAQRCSKCGAVVRGDRISQTTFDVCPH